MMLDPATIPSKLANRMLQGETWARDKLALHAGSTFALTIGPAAAAFRIVPDGTLENAPLAGVTPDLSLSISPLNLPSFLADPRQWNEHVREDGDAALGGTLKELAQTLPWFVEQAFARALGPIIGQRVADAGRQLLAFPAYAAERVAESLIRYARDEAQLMARGEELRRLHEQTNDVASRVDALAGRVAALSDRMAGARLV
jgi:ubiquinone biosynthesis accessory factor UbiJ